MKKYQHILLATDLHADNQPVVEQAIGLVERNNAKLSVVNVSPHIPYYMVSGVPCISDLESYLEEENIKHLKALEKQITVAAKFYLKHGSPKRKIVKMAAELDCDIIVIGSHGHHGVERFLGSTAAGVLQRAHCDVLVIRIK